MDTPAVGKSLGFSSILCYRVIDCQRQPKPLLERLAVQLRTHRERSCRRPMWSSFVKALAPRAR